MSRRRLRQDEIELWRKVTEKTEALHRTEVFDPEAPVLRKKPKEDFSGSHVRLDGKSPPKPAARKTTIDLLPPMPDRMAKAPLQMDRKTFARMNRGKLQPEARIDLHGMTLDRAHGALTRFVLSQHANGKRLILVITGKGKDRDEGGPIPTRRGVLRHQVPQWLSTAPLSSAVLQVAQAHVSHGGGGAYYVYLRRQR